jgi:hypothetical protein
MSNAYPYLGTSIAALSNLSIGKSNAAYALDVVGDVNFSGALRSNGVVFSGGGGTGLGVPNQVVFTSGSSTWTVPTGVTSVQVEMVGGGGGGSGGGTLYGSTAYDIGGGGGASGTAIVTLNVTPGQNLAYTVGAGGTGGAAYSAPSTSPTVGLSGGSSSITFGTSVITSPGGGGASVNGTNLNPCSTGGSGSLPTVSIPASAVVSQVLVKGGDGNVGSTPSIGNTDGVGGSGGSSYWGGGGMGGHVNIATSGSAYGSGGGGGKNITAPLGSGAAGAPGVVIITYFSQSGLPTTYTATAPLIMSGTALSIGYDANTVCINSSNQLTNTYASGSGTYGTNYLTVPAHSGERFFYDRTTPILIPSNKLITFKAWGMSGANMLGLAVDFYDSSRSAFNSQSSALSGQNCVNYTYVGTNSIVAQDNSTQNPPWLAYNMFNTKGVNAWPWTVELKFVIPSPGSTTSDWVNSSIPIDLKVTGHGPSGYSVTWYGTACVYIGSPSTATWTGLRLLQAGGNTVTTMGNVSYQYRVTVQD